MSESMFTANVFLICIILYTFFKYKSKQERQSDWIRFNPLDFSTYPPEGTQVLCYTSAWDRYYIAHMVYHDNIPKWTGSDEIINNNNRSLIWKYIEQDHVKK